MTPTPVIRAIVLPFGHTPATSLGGARPNDAEIPEHLRPLVQSLAHIPTPTPSPGYGIRIQITDISVDASIVQGDGWKQLKKGVAQHAGTANPSQNGNILAYPGISRIAFSNGEDTYLINPAPTTFCHDSAETLQKCR